MSQKPEKLHPYIMEASEQLRQGRVTRREFLRIATLLGASAVTASALAACGGTPATAPAATQAPGATVAAGATATPAAVAGAVKRGGVFRSAMQLQLLDHPARLSWVQGANVVRQVGEYLSETGSDNITRPMLLERWEATDDVKTWTLHLRQGIKFNNGDDFTADDVMFTFSQWLDPDVGSSTLGLMSYLEGMQSVEKVDDYTVRLHLTEGNIGVPEHLFHYPNIVLHRRFEGDYVRQPIGTGAFNLVEYAEGERAVFRRREDYWRMGADGQSLPYLDEIIYLSLDKDAAVAAMRGRQVDSMYQPRPSDFLALRDLPEFAVYPAQTAQAFVVRMRVDLEPWNDVRVRNALKKCQDRARILQLSYFGEGVLSLDAHVAPVHPAFCEQPVPAYDPEGARALLAEAGYPNGLKVTLATKNDQAEPEIAQALKELAAPGGFDITLDITEPGGYWDRWTEVDLGITAWTHRPLDTMVLPLAYIADSDGNPVPWNETRWVDDEFTTLLRQAERTLDVEVRRGLMCQLQGIMQERGPIANSYWNNVWTITRAEFKGIQGHPTSYDLLYEVWKDS
jgi:peptide/nickel transport system substrate-binding protein